MKTDHKKPCDKCPWTEKGQPLITDELRKTAEEGNWFCCHVNMGECIGAKNYGESRKRMEEKKLTCKGCGGELIVKPNMFYYRGTYFTGLVCDTCNALYDNPDDSFEEHVGLKPKKEC